MPAQEAGDDKLAIVKWSSDQQGSFKLRWYQTVLDISNRKL